MVNRMYDERYYLDESNVYEREFLLTEQRFWNIRGIYDGILYESLIKEYYSYINIVRKLVDEIVPNKDELTKMNIIMHLIRNGVFSHINTFHDKVPCEDIIKSKLGLNILDGYGCCRHFSSFINDIMPKSTPLTCVGEVDNPFFSEANHVINKVEYGGEIYGFDAFNNALFEYISEFEMKQIHEEEDMILYYKPYAEVMFYKRSFEEIKNFLEQIKESGKKSITAQEAKEIAFSSALSIYCNKEYISDFKRDTRVQLDSIKDQINEIRMSKK